MTETLYLRITEGILCECGRYLRCITKEECEYLVCDNKQCPHHQKKFKPPRIGLEVMG